MSSTVSYPQRAPPRSNSASHMSGGEGMHRVPTYSPTPSTSQQVFYPNQAYYAQPGANYAHMNDSSRSDMSGRPSGHQQSHGRIALPHNGGIVNVNPATGHKKRSSTPTPSPSNDPNCGPSPFLPEEDTSYGQPGNLPPHFEGQGMEHRGGRHNGEEPLYIRTPLLHHGLQPPGPRHHGMITSPDMGLPGYVLSPTDQMRMQHIPPHMNDPNGQHMSRPGSQGLQPNQPRPRPASQGQPQGRPMMVQRHSMHVQQRPPHLQRQMSLQLPGARSASPHMAAGDVFDPMPSGSPHMRPNSSLGFVENHAGPSGYTQDGMTMEYEYHGMDQNPSFYTDSQGISPARALGPAPSQAMRFSPLRHDDPMITPQTHKQMGYPSNIHSSATSSTATTKSSASSMTSGSNFSTGSDLREHHTEASDEENDSPTKGLAPIRVKRIPMDNLKPLQTTPIENRAPAKGPAPLARPPRPIGRLPSATIGGAGRTSAKFAKVAEDPGVEGIPPGPRPMDRPGPSFACIIGQAILKCKAGGLSLEHIYRYVETAYPYFKTGDGAWRNSVRHNLSIHKMFETIPRTEKYPAGKGGIWIIHEEEKCHWPEDNKFIKNFPGSHPHHANCRQTLHERQKEQEAMDRAAREGRTYIPKKGKKGRKISSKDEDDDDMYGMEMARSSSSLGEGRSSQITTRHANQPINPPTVRIHPQPTNPSALMTHSPNIPQALPPMMTSTPLPQVMSLSSEDFEDDSDFLPLEAEFTQMESKPVISELPPNSLRSEKLHVNLKKRRPTADEDIENVFTAPKRVRVSEPLAPINPHPQERLLPSLDDSYTTPERAGINQHHKSSMSSAFKTPALVNTSSSPGSSPMPTSILRGPHHPSSLQQAWTHDDVIDFDLPIPSSTPASSRGLEKAFDLKPLTAVHSRTRSNHLQEDEITINPLTSHLPGPPKTPVSRSSAATDKTPRLPFRTPGPLPLGAIKTPAGGFAGSPGMVPPSASQFLSTPLWEINSCLSRLGKGVGDFASPTRSPSRNSVPSTSPTRYAMLLPPVDGNGSPAKRRRMGDDDELRF